VTGGLAIRGARREGGGGDEQNGEGVAIREGRERAHGGEA
jgi:hypothetical protein